MISLCFFILPFTYFYAEEAIESEDELDLNFDLDDYDLDDEETTSSSIKGNRKGKSSACSRFWDKSYKALR